jgi:hypothetical protein
MDASIFIKRCGSDYPPHLPAPIAGAKNFSSSDRLACQAHYLMFAKFFFAEKFDQFGRPMI